MHECETHMAAPYIHLTINIWDVKGCESALVSLIVEHVSGTRERMAYRKAGG